MALAAPPVALALFPSQVKATTRKVVQKRKGEPPVTQEVTVPARHLYECLESHLRPTVRCHHRNSVSRFAPSATKVVFRHRPDGQRQEELEQAPTKAGSQGSLQDRMVSPPSNPRIHATAGWRIRRLRSKWIKPTWVAAAKLIEGPKVSPDA